VGSYHAAFKGRGMEFAEVREYQPGDDVRTIDWNVTARLGAHVKKYIEERDSPCSSYHISAPPPLARGLAKRDLAAELSECSPSPRWRTRTVGAILFSDEWRCSSCLRGEMRPSDRARHPCSPESVEGTSIQKAVRFARGI
jgi:hypothetical protein